MGEIKQRRGRNEGGLYRKTGKRVDPRTGEVEAHDYWQASREVPAQFLPDGVTRKRITGSGATKAEARARLDTNYATWLAKRSELATKPAPKRRHRHQLTVAEFFAAWHDGTQYTDLSDTMRLKYAAMFRDHIAPYLGEKFLNELNSDHINLLLFETLMQQRQLPPKKPGGSPRTIKPLGASARRNVYRTLSVMLNAAVAQGRLTRSPLAGVKPPKAVKPQADVLALTDKAIALMQDLQADGNADYCRHLFQYLGLRQSERLGLTWDCVRDLDGENPTIVVHQQLARHEKVGDDGPRGWYIKPHTKTRTVREVVLPEPFRTALREHRARWLGWQAQWEADRARWQAEHAAWKADGGFGPEPVAPRPAPALDGLVFVQPNGALIRPSVDTDDWHAVLDAHGLDYWRAHLNRHITATLLANQDPAPSDATVRAILGHETEAMLLYYRQVSTKSQRKPMTTYGEAFTTKAKRPKRARS